MEKTNYRKAKGFEIFKYSCGGLGSNLPFYLVLLYLTFYYTDVAHINAGIVAVLFLVAKAANAVTSILAGMLSDRTKSKLGKFRPWLIFGSPFLGLTVFLLFFIPNSLGTTGKTIYAFATYIIYSCLSSAVNVPYHSLPAVITDDPDQRTTVVMGKQVMGVIASVLISAGALPFVAMLGNGYNGWVKFAAIIAVIVVISFWICASGVKQYDTEENCKQETSNSKEKITVGAQFKLISKNFPLLMLIVAFGCDMIAMSLSSASNVYFFTYNLHKQNLIVIYGLVSTLITLPVSFIVPPLTKKFGKKKLLFWGYIFATIPLLVLYFLPYSNVVGIILMFTISAGVFQITNICGWAALADCVEYGEWKTGLRGEGIVTSSLTFINDLGGAIGGMLTGAILAAVGYIAGKTQPQIVLVAIKHMRVTAPIIAYIISIIAMYFYPIDNNFFNKILSDLNKRKSAKIKSN